MSLCQFSGKSVTSNSTNQYAKQGKKRKITYWKKTIRHKLDFFNCVYVD